MAPSQVYIMGSDFMGQLGNGVPEKDSLTPVMPNSPRLAGVSNAAHIAVSGSTLAWITVPDAP